MEKTKILTKAFAALGPKLLDDEETAAAVPVAIQLLNTNPLQIGNPDLIQRVIEAIPKAACQHISAMLDKYTPNESVTAAAALKIGNLEEVMTTGTPINSSEFAARCEHAVKYFMHIRPLISQQQASALKTVGSSRQVHVSSRTLPGGGRGRGKPTIPESAE